MAKKLEFLVVNDDGVREIGIAILAKHLAKYGNVTVVAPSSARSAASHSICLHKNLSFNSVDYIENTIAYETDGSPADCVRLATSILGDKFDIVFSGINNGLNLGTDIIYSGTVAAAREAFIEGYPSVAISTSLNGFGKAEEYLDSILDYIIINRRYSKNYTLNINYPNSKFAYCKGIKECQQGIKRFNSVYELKEDGKYGVKEDIISYDTNPNTDVFLANEGYITITKLVVDQNYER